MSKSEPIEASSLDSRALSSDFSTPWRSWKAWASLLLGVALVGLGIGLMVEAGWGVSPLDAFFSGVSNQSEFSMGIVLAVFSVAMVLVAWLFGIKPAIGTLVCALGIGIFVDIARIAYSGLAPDDLPIPLMVVLWLVGLAIFCLGVIGLFASELGASPYDQLTKATAKVLRVSLGVARIILDGIALLIAFLLGGSWGVGTLVLLLVVPIILNKALPWGRRIVHGPALADQ